jgi:hypothetical protein
VVGLLLGDCKPGHAADFEVVDDGADVRGGFVVADARELERRRLEQSLTPRYRLERR